MDSPFAGKSFCASSMLKPHLVIIAHLSCWVNSAKLKGKIKMLFEWTKKKQFLQFISIRICLNWPDCKKISGFIRNEQNQCFPKIIQCIVESNLTIWAGARPQTYQQQYGKLYQYANSL